MHYTRLPKYLFYIETPTTRSRWSRGYGIQAFPSIILYGDINDARRDVMDCPAYRDAQIIQLVAETIADICKEIGEEGERREVERWDCAGWVPEDAVVGVVPA